jgi:hypothetical protein
VAIYFLQEDETDYYRIGYSGDYRTRIRTHQGTTPRLMRFLGLIPGDLMSEQLLHAHLRKTFVHLRGEWYECTPALKRFVETLLGRAPAPTLDIDPRESTTVA